MSNGNRSLLALFADKKKGPADRSISRPLVYPLLTNSLFLLDCLTKLLLPRNHHHDADRNSKQQERRWLRNRLWRSVRTRRLFIIRVRGCCRSLTRLCVEYFRTAWRSSKRTSGEGERQRCDHRKNPEICQDLHCASGVFRKAHSFMFKTTVRTFQHYTPLHVK